jgi:hypothetical protein
LSLPTAAHEVEIKSWLFSLFCIARFWFVVIWGVPFETEHCCGTNLATENFLILIFAIIGPPIISKWIIAYSIFFSLLAELLTQVTWNRLIWIEHDMDWQNYFQNISDFFNKKYFLRSAFVWQQLNWFRLILPKVFISTIKKSINNPLFYFEKRKSLYPNQFII